MSNKSGLMCYTCQIMVFGEFVCYKCLKLGLNRCCHCCKKAEKDEHENIEPSPEYIRNLLKEQFPE